MSRRVVHVWRCQRAHLSWQSWCGREFEGGTGDRCWKGSLDEATCIPCLEAIEHIAAWTAQQESTVALNAMEKLRSVRAKRARRTRRGT